MIKSHLLRFFLRQKYERDYRGKFRADFPVGFGRYAYRDLGSGHVDQKTAILFRHLARPGPKSDAVNSLFKL